MLNTVDKLVNSDFPRIKRKNLEILQVNLGYKCNQQCLHCHVNAGPRRKEIMQRETIDVVLHTLVSNKIKILDLTGGAPELNPDFRYLVSHARAAGVHVIDRCNLTVLLEPGQADTAEFLAHNKVEVIASLPCYLEDNVDKQRGKGVFADSIKGIKQLNALGYGISESGLAFNLVYNPIGANLPPAQQALESDYKRELKVRYGISFNHLFTITNMPINRFGSTLLSKGTFYDYMTLLRNSHLAENLDTLMCRNTLSVDWQGYVYDCDFNQMLGFYAPLGARPRVHLKDVDVGAIAGKPIAVADHCYGCTAGQGSSCGGALS